MTGADICVPWAQTSATGALREHTPGFSGQVARHGGGQACGPQRAGVCGRLAHGGARTHRRGAGLGRGARAHGAQVGRAGRARCGRAGGHGPHRAPSLCRKRPGGPGLRRHQPAHRLGADHFQAECGGPHDRIAARRCRGPFGARAGDRHRLWLPGCCAQPAGPRGLQHRAPQGPAREGAREPAPTAPAQRAPDPGRRHARLSQGRAVCGHHFGCRGRACARQLARTTGRGWASGGPHRHARWPPGPGGRAQDRARPRA